MKVCRKSSNLQAYMAEKMLAPSGVLSHTNFRSFNDDKAPEPDPHHAPPPEPTYTAN
jgi:hypothetical protein